ncbi:MAG: hemerythrin domain-containing protein [Acidobacteriota bacterium]
MMNIFDVLMEEHRGFKTMLDVLEAIAARLARNEAVPHGMVSDVLDFFELFADRHHGKEEDLLFPVLAQHGIGTDQTVVAALMSQHEAGRAYGHKMREDLSRLRAGSAGAAADLAAHARGYTELIREHIRIEDEYFYRLAEEVLTSAEKEAIFRQFRPGNLTTEGARDRDRYLEMLRSYPPMVADWR